MVDLHGKFNDHYNVTDAPKLNWFRVVRFRSVYAHPAEYKLNL